MAVQHSVQRQAGMRELRRRGHLATLQHHTGTSAEQFVPKALLPVTGHRALCQLRTSCEARSSVAQRTHLW